MPPTATRSPRRAKAVAPVLTACPHCKHQFEAAIDRTQPLRLQGIKCPSSTCKLFIPARMLAEQVIAPAPDTTR